MQAIAVVPQHQSRQSGVLCTSRKTSRGEPLGPASTHDPDYIGQLLAAASINVARLRENIDKRASIGYAAATNHDAADLHTPLEKTEWILRRTSDDVRSISHALGTSGRV